MRFLVDENVPPSFQRELASRGHDVTSFARGAEDAEVLRFATRDDRVLITFDADFGELVFRDSQPSIGIILFRFSPRPPDETTDVFARLLDSGLDLEGNFTVIDRQNIRQRPLPG